MTAPGSSVAAAAGLDQSWLDARGLDWRHWILDALSRGCSVPSMVGSMIGPTWSAREARQALRQGQALLRLHAAERSSGQATLLKARRRAGDRVFVSVAAYCEPHLLHTVADAASKATRPENLVFGVVDQHPDVRRDALIEAAGLAEVRYVSVPPAHARGVCWARAIAFSLAGGERYLLQIDSHMLFEAGWDDALIDQYDALTEAHGGYRHILTTYPMGFEFRDGIAVAASQPAAGTVLVLRPRAGERMTHRDVRMNFEARAEPAHGPVRGNHVAAGFMFTDLRFVQEIPYDPFLYFAGEEQSLAMRAFTRGWDIWHPVHVPLFHLYKPPGRSYDQHHWNDEADRTRDTHWRDLDHQARERMLDLVLGRKDLGVYGLGSIRGLADLYGRGWRRRHRSAAVADALPPGSSHQQTDQTV